MILQSDFSKKIPVKLIFVVALGAFVSSLHFLTSTHAHYLHLIYDRLCYLPVILAAYWFGLRGGVLMGASMSVMHLAHIYLSWNGHFFTANLYQTLEAFVHLFLGFVTGFLSERFIKASKKLELSYRDLQEKTLQVLNAEEQLRRTERIQALAELSAGVAHEIRTPLASIKGSAEILANESLKPEQREEFTTILLKESRHLSNIVNEFLSFARPQKTQQVECRIPEVIDVILDLTLQQRRSKEIKIEKRYATELPSIYFDADQLKQVFVNLISNSIQAMPKGGTLTISAKRENDSITCMIEDTGSGIPDHIHTRIFDPFFTTRPNGTGLGLSIVQKIMNHHQCSIDAVNRESGGACFILQFPIARSFTNE
ncbi:MAG: ATP-binding protein [Candidatus Hinthialibacter antarcticus]|nr:ATP-binding protein [Candidatus Hinthialibacter antarcticus]